MPSGRFAVLCVRNRYVLFTRLFESFRRPIVIHRPFPASAVSIDSVINNTNIQAERVKFFPYNIICFFRLRPNLHRLRVALHHGHRDCRAQPLVCDRHFCHTHLHNPRIKRIPLNIFPCAITIRRGHHHIVVSKIFTCDICHIILRNSCFNRYQIRLFIRPCAAGTTGATRTTGATGAIGTAGAAGTAGVAGIIGASGVAGVVRPAGNIRTAGAAGPVSGQFVIRPVFWPILTPRQYTLR